MKRLVVQRNSITKRGIFGMLLLLADGELTPLCHTLEPSPNYYLFSSPTKSWYPAIDPSIYPLIVNYSPKFRKKLPLLCCVDNRSGIRIHSGNTQDDTTGCILVGVSRRDFSLVASKVALDYVMNVIKAYGISEICVDSSYVTL